MKLFTDGKRSGTGFGNWFRFNRDRDGWSAMLFGKWFGTSTDAKVLGG